MRSIGEFMRLSRRDRGVTLEKIEKETKIKKTFIRAIERERWEELPEFPVVLGFVKVLSNLYEVDGSKAIAMLKRDYPPKSMSINPKPDVEKRFVWSPKITFAILLGLVLSIVFGYLAYQLYEFNKPPKLEISAPVSGQMISSNMVEVAGSTNPDSSVIVNNQPVFVDEDGNFTSSLGVSGQTEEIVVVSKLRSGKVTTVKIPVDVTFE